LKLLADENFPGPSVRALRSAGFDVAWIAEVLPGAADEAVISFCAAGERTLLTFDKDFGELAFHRGLAANSGVILFRVPQDRPDEITAAALAVVEMRQEWTGLFAVVTPRGVRIRTIRP